MKELRLNTFHFEGVAYGFSELSAKIARDLERIHTGDSYSTFITIHDSNFVSKIWPRQGFVELLSKNLPAPPGDQAQLDSREAHAPYDLDAARPRIRSSSTFVVTRVTDTAVDAVRLEDEGGISCSC